MQLDKLLKPGGRVSITFRADLYETDSEIRDVLEKVGWEQVIKQDFTIFDDEAMYAFIFLKEP